MVGGAIWDGVGSVTSKRTTQSSTQNVEAVDNTYDVDIAIGRFADGKATSADFKLFAPENTSNRNIFYKTFDVKLPQNPILTNYRLLALNNKNRNINNLYLKHIQKPEVDAKIKDFYLKHNNPLKQPDSLTGNGEGGIMEMYRKKEIHRRLNSDGRKIIDKATYHKIVNPILKKGADIRIADNEWIKHLEKENASAVTIGNVIFFKPDCTISDVLEETHHFMQNKKGLNSQYGKKQREILNEIDAKEFLLTVAEKYKIPEEEIILTRSQLENYKNQMKELKEMGEWYD